MGTVGILNVGAGDTKLTFDKSNPQECIRAGRIVRDMIRRGYALLIEVDGKYQRAVDFDEKTSEYIIADFDPVTVAAENIKNERNIEPPAAAQIDEGPDESPKPKPLATPRLAGGRRRGGATRRVDAASTNAVGVARSAGG